MGIWRYVTIRLGTWCFIWHSIDTHTKKFFYRWMGEIADFHYSHFLFRKLNMKNGIKKFINSLLCSCIVEVFLIYFVITTKKKFSQVTSIVNLNFLTFSCVTKCSIQKLIFWSISQILDLTAPSNMDITYNQPQMEITTPCWTWKSACIYIFI